jgi:hypothetical protein
MNILWMLRFISETLVGALVRLDELTTPRDRALSTFYFLGDSPREIRRRSRTLGKAFPKL